MIGALVFIIVHITGILVLTAGDKLAEKSTHKKHKSIKFSFGPPLRRHSKNQNGIVVAMTRCAAIMVMFAKKMGVNKSAFVYPLKEHFYSDLSQNSDESKVGILAWTTTAV